MFYAQDIAHALKGSWQKARGADGCPEPLRFHAISTDSRQLQPGALFVALVGPRYDAHDFLVDAERAGALAAVVSRPPQTSSLPYIQVEDTREALLDLAHSWRRQFKVPLVAVTGSCGKTSTKTMIGHILSKLKPTWVSQGNFNNDIGMPLSVLQWRDHHRYAVLELATSGPGEIARLVRYCEPNIVVITNAAPVHLEGLGDLQGVVRAKGEIIEGIRKRPDGVAVLCADSPHYAYWKSLLTCGKVISFGVEAPWAQVRASDLVMDSSGCAQFHLKLPDRRHTQVKLPVLGSHQVLNALAATAVAFALGVDLEIIQSGLETVPGVASRLQRKQISQDMVVLDDSYNANPLSLKAALQVLSGCSGIKILVLGDMKELGEQEQAIHREAGELARIMGVDGLYAYGALSRKAADAFGPEAWFFDDQDDLCTHLQQKIRDYAGEQVTILVKGSRSMRLERVVHKISCFMSS